MAIKKIINLFGYDVKKYRPIYKFINEQFKIKTIIDIGANTGEYTRNIRSYFPEAQIYAFEPLTDCFNQLNTKMLEDKKFKAWNIALGNESGFISIKRSSFHPSSSILEMEELHKNLYPKSKGSTIEKIKIDKLDNIFKPEELNKNTLIKIDVQGFEDQVIKGGENIIKNSSIVIIETSFVKLYKNQILFNEILKLMDELDFSYYGSAERHFTKDNKLIYEDSIFIKKDLISI